MSFLIACLLLLLCAAACNDKGVSSNLSQVSPAELPPADDSSDNPEAPEEAPDAAEVQEARFILLFGDDVAPGTKEDMLEFLSPRVSLPLEVATECDSDWNPNSRLLSFGNTAAASDLLGDSPLEGLELEGFKVKSGMACGLEAMVAIGRGRGSNSTTSIGTTFGAFALLEELGFGFWHPMDPVMPELIGGSFPSVNLSESPYWGVRGFQIHTMHPTELVELLNGWGESAMEDQASFEAMLPEWDKVLTWLVANRQNYVHWVLLWSDDWQDFADSTKRQDRLRTLVERAHRYDLFVGVDVPIALEQQHAWRLIRNQGELADELAEMRANIDYIMEAGFDYLATESGTSEFTHPAPSRMVAWMDELARYLDEEWNGAEAFIKVHASAGQTAEGYPDPETGEDINFNFLPYYADSRLGVLPHSVQIYALDDPAPTYSNDNFDYIRKYLHQEVGRRPVVWHPETAYWVSYDIDVPLFLPVYAHRRLHDLRLLAQDEISGEMAVADARMRGQLIFSSGWEWGYWLNDVVTARAAWNPRMNLGTDAEAMHDLLSRIFRPFGEASQPIVETLVDYMEEQLALLVEGKINGVAPEDIYKRSGQAYLQGVDAWDDVGTVAANIPGIPEIETQPKKLGLVDMRNPIDSGPGYSSEIEPLLREMSETFGAAVTQWRSYERLVPENVLPYFAELDDSLKMTALRSAQVHGLYDYVDGFWDFLSDTRQERLEDARSALDEAFEIVAVREANYRVPADRVAGWRVNPTSYDYRFLWTVRTLYYWWRDEGKAYHAPISPCYMNHINPFDVAFGDGLYHDLAELASNFTGETIAECLVAPSAEPTIPPPGMRD